MSATDPKYIFVHIFKCAGTFFLGGIRYSFPDPKHLVNYSTLNDQDIANKTREAKVIHGHCYYGLHEAAQCSAIYLTILRDPVDRVLSSYYYLKEARCSGHPLHKLVNKYPLEECMNPASINGIDPAIAGTAAMEFNNRQTRMLCGNPRIAKMQYREDYNPDVLTLTTHHLNTAIDHLGHFSFIGLSNQTDFYWPVLRARFGFQLPDPNWQSANPHYSNKTVSRPKRNEIDAKLAHKIAQANALDVSLLQWAHANRDRVNDQPIQVIK